MLSPGASIARARGNGAAPVHHSYPVDTMCQFSGHVRNLHVAYSEFGSPYGIFSNSDLAAPTLAYPIVRYDLERRASGYPAVRVAYLGVIDPTTH